MTIRHQRSVGLGLSSAAIALALVGCAGSAASERPGALALRMDPEASYALVGRFHLNALEPWSPSRDIDFDTTTSQVRLELPAGTFTLALAAGARLVCAGEQAEPLGASAPRLVSAPPQVISITPGELTTAHVSFGALPVPGQAAPADESGWAAPADPCSSPLALTDLAAVAERARPLRE